MICFLDLDGVVVDFVGAVEKRYRIVVDEWEFDSKIPGVSKTDFWLSCHNKFWANLEWTLDGKEILEIVESHFGGENICLLTTPCKTTGCMDGKEDWIKRHLPQYAETGQWLIGPGKRFAAGLGKVLIDDSNRNIDAFKKAGGEAILIPRKWNRLSWLCFAEDKTPFSVPEYLREALEGLKYGQ